MARSEAGRGAGAPGSRSERLRRSLRYWTIKGGLSVIVRLYVRLRVEGLDRLPPGPSLLCVNHQSWADPFILVAALPGRPRLYWFGPKEADMSRGARNRLIVWAGTAVPYRPAKNDLLEATRRVSAVFAAGHRMGIFGEGRIHAREGELLPLAEGAVFFAMRAGVPIVPIGIGGTSWLGFGRTVRVRVGEPVIPSGRPTRAALDALTARLWCDLFDLVRDDRDRPLPGRVGRWLTELFDEWPEGRRPDRTPGAIGPVARELPVAGPHGPCPPVPADAEPTAGDGPLAY